MATSNEWLPQSSQRLATRPHFEVLGEHYRPMDPQAREEVWIPFE
jgi:AraC family transcriptional regulator